MGFLFLSYFWGQIFYVFMGKKKVFFNCFYIVASALKSCIVSLLWILFYNCFFQCLVTSKYANTYSNSQILMYVLHEGLLMQDWVFRLGPYSKLYRWSSLPAHYCRNLQRLSKNYKLVYEAFYEAFYEALVINIFN